MNKYIYLIFMITVESAYAGFFDNNTSLENSNDLHEIACTKEKGNNSSLWNISSLYDCKTKTIFIPYQLWSGAKWDGNKDSSCIHKADSTFYVNGKSGTTIKGPEDWENPKTSEIIKIWKREKLNGSKQQYFTCNKKGIGRVYDSRKGGRYYDNGRCKFPAGYGWEIGKQRKCNSTAIEIIKIEIDSENNLEGLEFKWWYQNRNGDFVHDHTYRYEPNIGSVNAWKQ
jgi:hypothetical protein